MPVNILIGSYVSESAILEDGVEIGYNAVVLSGGTDEQITHIHSGVIVGPNSTIVEGVKIGAGANVCAGSVVLKNVPPFAIVSGNPAKIVGYVNAVDDFSKDALSEPVRGSKVISLGVGGSCLYTLPLIPDMRGNLSVAEYAEQIPFIPKRLFWVFDVPSREVRGEHAHKALHQYLICVKGSVNVVIDDGHSRKEVALNQPNMGLHIPPLVWGIQYKYTQDAVLLVLASDAYDANDYLRNYDEFRAYVGKVRVEE